MSVKVRFPTDAGGPQRPWSGPPPAVRWLGLIAIVPLLAVLGVCYWWFVQRVEVQPGQVLVLIRKVGQPLPAQAGAGGDEISQQAVLYPALLAKLGEPPDSIKYKGVIYQPLPEGRYFRDPFVWERIIVPAVTIAQTEIGILIRKYGKPLPPGRIVAIENDERGPVAEVLKPGRYNINPYAYEVLRVAPVVIPAGYVGVRTLYHGRDPANPNDYVVAEGERGVQPTVYPPGMYYNNPYVQRIDQIDVRSHTVDMHRDDAIRFPSNDSFDILLDCTVEYAVRQDLAPYVMVAIGTHDDIRDKLILPYARSLSRIEGSKLLARDFVSGEMRGEFQKRVFDGLREQCHAQGIEVRATLVRQIVPPAAIAGPISDRQLAAQQVRQYESEIKTAQAEAALVEQQEMQKQNQAVGQANREVVAKIKEAEQFKAVALTEVQQRLEVARLNLEAARQTAAAIVARGKAEAEVLLLTYRAEAEPLREAVAAFGDGQTYAQFFFYQKLGPAVKSVLASMDGPFAEVFQALTPAKDQGGGTREPGTGGPRAPGPGGAEGGRP